MSRVVAPPGELLEALRKPGGRILCLGHVHPDGDVLGTLVDKRVDANLQREAPAIHQVVENPNVTTKYGMVYHDLNQQAVAALPEAEQSKVNEIRGTTKQGTLKTVSILPAIMFVCYVGLIFYFLSKGGYRVQHLTMSGEKASGGVEGPVR